MVSKDMKKTKAQLVEELSELRRNLHSLEEGQNADALASDEFGSLEISPTDFTILVVDDSSIVRKSLKRDLTKTGYKVNTASTGQKALDKLDPAPAAVLLDLHMPDLDGLHVLKQIRRSKPDLPVIMLTAAAELETRIDAFKAGADDYLIKPYHSVELLARINRVLERERMRMMIEIESAEKKRSQEKLRKSDVFFRSLVQRSTDITVVIDKDGVVKYQSPSAERIFGHTPSERLGKDAFHLVHSDDLGRVMSLLNEAITNPGTVTPLEIRFMHKDGNWKDLEVIANNLLDDSLIEGIVINARDITERKRAEEALKASQRKYQDLYDNIPDMFVSVDVKTANIIQCNQATLDSLGYTKEELIGRNISEVYHPESEEKRKMVFKQFLDASVVKDEEFKLRRKDGSHFDVSLNVTAERDEEGNIIYSRSIWRDITFLKRSEKKLKEKTDFLEAIFQSASESIIIIDQYGKYVMINAVSGEIMGYKPEDWIGKEAGTNTHPDDRNVVASAYLKALGGNPTECEARVKAADGSYKVINFSLFPLRYADNPNVLGIISDITERKRIDDELRQSEENYRNLVESTDDWVWSIDSAGVHTFSNNALEKTLGYCTDEIIGKSAFPIMHPDDADRWRSKLSECIAEKTGWRKETVRWLDKAGNTFHFESSADPILDASGEVIGFNGIDRDVTERKITEERRRLTNKVLKTLNQTTGKADTIKKLLSTIKEFSGCEAVSIRLKDGEDFPYYVSSGFPEEFVEAENYLCAKDRHNEIIRDSKGDPVLECMCENIISGRTDPAQSFFTEGGSFWSSCMTELLASTTEEDRQARTRNRCNSEGYESVALIPLRSGEKIIGLLQLNDSRVGCFTEDVIRFFENMGASIGIALDKAMIAEERLKERDYLLNVFGTMEDGVYITDRSHDIRYLNRALIKEFGEPEGRKCYEYYRNTKEPCTNCSIEEVLSGKSIRRGWRSKRNNKDYDLIDSPLMNSDGSISKLTIFRDVTERKQIEEALKESERMLAEAQQVADIGSWAWNFKENTLAWSDNAFIQFGFKVNEISPTYEVFEKMVHPDDLENVNRAVKDALEGKKDYSIDFRVISNDGRKWLMNARGKVYRDAEGNPLKFLGTQQDITEKRKMEQEIQKAQKLESVGVLAGGIAHDFNNILTALYGNIQLAKMDMDPESDIGQMLMESETACERARSLTQQLLTFAKGGEPVKKTMSIAGPLRESIDFSLRGSNVRCEITIPDDIWLVEIDQGQMNQVLNNLIINSDQAMPGGGVIRARAKNIADPKAKGLPLGEGKYIKVSIEDHGIGISEEHLPKIFDPFFTTKQKGNGLGLATSYSIVNKHNGHLTAKSELGAGTTMEIYLPASQVPVQPDRKKETKYIAGQGKVLLMDDEKQVRTLTGRMLKRLGYEVEFANNGDEAIKAFNQARECSKPYTAVILDLTIPGGMGGKGTINKLLEIDPDVKAIVASGYSNDPVLSNHQEHGFKGAIAKPFQINELSEVLNRVIEDKE